jgi:hypothetical protein
MRPAETEPVMYNSIEEIKDANAVVGQLWFSPATMRFFDSRIESGVLRGAYFVTSEQPPGGPRVFSVRYADERGYVTTIGEFGAYTTRAAAIAAVNTL